MFMDLLDSTSSAFGGAESSLTKTTTAKRPGLISCQTVPILRTARHLKRFSHYKHLTLTGLKPSGLMKPA